MSAEALAHAPWERLANFVALRTGLHFPPDRRGDLERGFVAAMKEFDFTDCARCAEWVLSGGLTQAQLRTLASHLTIGETYFLRERNTFEALSTVILPKLISRRRGREQRLRLWSAACCTGEEAYSLAILLQQLLPDWREWNITILATDINERYLHKAAAGIYSDWSFRDCPPSFKDCYFTPMADGRYQIAEQFRRSVKIAQINLAEDSFPSLHSDIHAMDVILCRNLLLYFTPSQSRKLVDKLYGALADQGWLGVSPSECSHTLFARFEGVNFPGVILYLKDPAKEGNAPAYAPITPEPLATCDSLAAGQEPAAACTEKSTNRAASAEAVPPPLAAAENAFSQRRYAKVVELLLTLSADPSTGDEARTFSLLARAYANQGRLTEALLWTTRWIDANKAEPAAHYVHAMILQEKGDSGGARRALQSATYLQPDFALAHFALGNLARADGRAAQAHKHFANALRALRHHSADEVLPESDGITVGRLMQTISAVTGGTQ